MRLIRPADMPEVDQRWDRPAGSYRRGTRDVFSGAKLPFEVELVRLPPGAVNWPFHAHSVMWECYLLTAGRGRVRTPEGWTEVRAGDALLHPPGEPHQMENTGPDDLVYWIIADNAPDRTTIHEG